MKDQDVKIEQLKVKISKCHAESHKLKIRKQQLEQEWTRIDELREEVEA